MQAHTAPAAPEPTAASAPGRLRSLWMTWAAAGLLPLPPVAAGDLASSADVACLYLALASAWLATEIVRAGGPPESRAAWRARLLAIALAASANTAVFSAMG